MTGGRLDYDTSTKVFDYHASERISVAAEATFKAVIGSASASTSVETQTALTSFERASVTQLLTYGGAPEKAAMIGVGTKPEEKTARYEAWLATVPGQQVFVDFGSPDCLRGIWTLCDDPARREEIESAAAAFLAQRDQLNRIDPDRVVDVVVIAGNNAGIAAPAGYERINYDLNRRSGGAYIYACFRKESADVIAQTGKKPVVDLAVIAGGSSGIAAPAGYEKIPVDLNKGSGGKFIYLCKKFGTAGDGETGLRDITVVGGNHANIAPPYRYKRLGTDLNWGSGGDYIYMCLV